MEVSVVIPTYNRANHVARAIKSVLLQTYTDYEIIVVDDGSTDETRSILEGNFHHITYVYQDNAGPAAARNKGIMLASGKWLAFLDSDDVWLPNKLQMQLSQCLNLNADLCFHDLSILNPGGDNIRSWNEHVHKRHRSLDSLKTGILLDAYQRMMAMGHIFLTTTFFAKRAVVNDVGYFKEDLRTSEDVEFFFRLAARYRVAYISEALAVYSPGPHRVTDSERIYMDRITAIKRSLEDRLVCEDIVLAEWARKGLLQETRSLAGFYRRSGSYYSSLLTYAKYFVMRRAPLAGLVDQVSSNVSAAQAD